MADPDAPAPRTKGRPTLDQAEQIDHAIREAAMQVMRDQDEPATLNAVAKVAGLSRKSLYARYPTKAALFLAVIRDVLTAAEPLTFARGASFPESLHNYITAALDAIAGPGAQAIQRLMLLNPDYIATLRTEMPAAMRNIFAGPLRHLLQDAIAAGEIILTDEDLTVESIMKLIVVRDMDGIDSHLPADSRDWTARQANFLTGFICRGLVPPTAD
ncbi:MAG: TetR/AcrR family transcriptional regulator [Sphingobium sp.]